MTVNTAVRWNHRKQFSNGFKIVFPYYAKRASSFRDCFKKAYIQFKRNALRNENEEY